MSTKTKKRVYIAAGSIVLVGIIVGVIFFILNLNKPTPTMEDMLGETDLGSNINSLVTVAGEPASTVLIAPSNEKWWYTLTAYTPNPVVYGLDYDRYSKGSEYLAYTLSPGAGFESYGSIGLPTTFIVYEDDKKALTAASLLEADGIAHQLIANMVFFVPEGAQSDVNYALNQFTVAEGKEEFALGDDEAQLFFGYGALKQLFTKNIEEKDAVAFDTLAGMMGITTDTYWSGSSNDGFTWDGFFTGLDVKNISSPTDISTYMSSLWYVKDENGEYVLGDEFASEHPLDPDSKGGDLPGQSGLIDTAQATIMATGALAVRSNDDTGGTDANGDKLPVLPASEGVFQAVFGDVNSFLGLMHSDDAIYPYTTFDTMTFTVKADGSSNVKLALSKNILGEETVNALGDPNAKIKDLLVTESDLSEGAEATEAPEDMDDTLPSP